MSFKNVKAFFRRSLNDTSRVSGKSKQYHSSQFNRIGSNIATGGIITQPGNGYRYHFFTSPGTLIVETSSTYDISIIAGGGGGGGQSGGGGGGGGIVTKMSQNLMVATYVVTVGNGGIDSPLNGRGSTGDASSVSGSGLNPSPSFVAAGGGYGGGASGPQPGGDGGSGGGGRQSTPPGAIEPGGAGNVPPQSPPQGNPGAPGNSSGGGGGGGAGGSTGSGSGGAGRGLFPTDPTTFDDGIPSDYGEPNGSYQVFAGGGAGTRGGSGGVGGGGDINTAGQANTGGGGGGGPNPGTGRAGGSGLVVFRQSIT